MPTTSNFIQDNVPRFANTLKEVERVINESNKNNENPHAVQRIS